MQMRMYMHLSLIICVYIYIWPWAINPQSWGGTGHPKVRRKKNWVWTLGLGPVRPGLARYCSAQLSSARLAQFSSLGSAWLALALHPKMVVLRRRNGILKKNIAFHVGETRLDFLKMHFTCTRSSLESAVVEMWPFGLHRTATYRMHLQSLPVPSASSTA